MKSLFNGSIKEFRKLTNSELNLWKWRIYDATISERYHMVESTSYVVNLKRLADYNKMNYDEYEIISWLDSQMVVLKIIKLLEEIVDYNYLESIRIIQEYHIPFVNKRADYLFIKDNKILIVEFSYANFNKTDYQFQTKLNQVINYKELISNIVSRNIDIATYTFILNPEDEDYEINYDQIYNFVHYLLYFFSSKDCNAYTELTKIDKIK